MSIKTVEISERWTMRYQALQNIHKDNHGMGGHLASVYNAAAEAAEYGMEAIQELSALEARQNQGTSK